MKRNVLINPSVRAALCLAAVLTTPLRAAELPRLPAGTTPASQNHAAQARLPDLGQPYVSTAPQDLKDGLTVGRLERPGTEAAVQALLKNDRAGRFGNLDSVLLWHDGKLVFEYYNRRGRVDGPHYAMSVTKTLTSVTLARAIQLGHLKMADLDRLVLDLMPRIDRSKIRSGVDTITLRDVLMMKSGLRFKDKALPFKLGFKHRRQAYFQALFEHTEPVSPRNKEYKYAGTDPSIVLMILDLAVPGSVQDFITREVAGKFGAIYNWGDQECGIPKGGAGSSFTSRSLVKIGSAILRGGQYHGGQLLSAEYVYRVMDTEKGDGYFYYFHNRSKWAPNDKIDFISGIGAGGQYMAAFPDLGLVAVATAHNRKQIGLPLKAILDHFVPLFRD